MSNIIDITTLCAADDDKPGKMQHDSDSNALMRTLFEWLFDHLGKLEPRVAVDEVLASRVDNTRAEILDHKEIFIRYLNPTFVINEIHWNALQQDGLSKVGVKLLQFLSILCVHMRETGKRKISFQAAIELMLPLQDGSNRYLEISSQGKSRWLKTTYYGRRKFGHELKCALLEPSVTDDECEDDEDETRPYWEDDEDE